MAKTYNSLSNVTVGSVLTASDYNEVLENSNNYRVPPLVQVRRDTNLTSYTAGTAIAWQSTGIASTDDTMWTAGAATRVTINTAGLYVVNYTGTAGGSATVTLVSAAIMRNGTSVSNIYMPTVLNSTQFSVTAILSLTATDYVEANNNFSGGSAYFVNGSGTLGVDQSRLTVAWIGQVS